MIHVLTVHWKDATWVDIQLEYLRRNISDDYRVYAFLNDVPGNHADKYFYCSTEPIEKHAIKLNLLADIASFNADGPDDLLVFIDGDAFPISNISEFARRTIGKYPLAAIQRVENAGDIQPHPCFCMTTVGFWKQIKGDWKAGFEWRNGEGRMVTDVGGNLLKILQEQNVEWYPLKRTNKKNIHPLWFGIYDDLVYHHGAGFRSAMVSRLDWSTRWETTPSRKARKILLDALPSRGPIRKLKKKLAMQEKMVDEIDKKNRAMARDVLNMIQNDAEFHRLFMS